MQCSFWPGLGHIPTLREAGLESGATETERQMGKGWLPKGEIWAWEGVMATVKPCTTGQQESVHRESASFTFWEESAPGTVQWPGQRSQARGPSERDSEPPDDSCPWGAVSKLSG